MKKLWKTIITVSLALMLCVTMMGSVFAASQQQATLDYMDIKITLDGRPITPTDANGNVVEPFAITGTTYLPVRAISTALGLDVKWDPNTKTVQLSTPAEARTIYITRTGSKYHFDGSCNGGTYWPVPLSTAIGMGLTPCEKCAH